AAILHCAEVGSSQITTGRWLMGVHTQGRAMMEPIEVRGERDTGVLKHRLDERGDLAMGEWPADRAISATVQAFCHHRPETTQPRTGCPTHRSSTREHALAYAGLAASIVNPASCGRGGPGQRIQWPNTHGKRAAPFRSITGLDALPRRARRGNAPPLAAVLPQCSTGPLRK